MTEINRDDKRHSCNITLEHFVRVISEAVQKKFPTLQDESNNIISAGVDSSLSSLLDIPLVGYYNHDRKMTKDQLDQLVVKLNAINAISASISKQWDVEIMPMSIITSKLAFLHQEVVDRVNNKYSSMNIFVEKLNVTSESNPKFRAWFDNSRTEYYQVTLNGKVAVAKYSIETVQTWDGGAEDHRCIEVNIANLGLERFALPMQNIKEALAKLISKSAHTRNELIFSGDPLHIALLREDLSGRDYSGYSMRDFYSLEVELTPLEKKYEQHLDGNKGSTWLVKPEYDFVGGVKYFFRVLHPKDHALESFRNSISIQDGNGIPVVTMKDIKDNALEIPSKTFVDLLKAESLLSYDLPEFISQAVVTLLEPESAEQKNDFKQSAKLSVAHALYHLRRCGLSSTFVNNTDLQHVLNLLIKQNDLEALLIQCSYNNPALMSLVLYSSDNVEDCNKAGKAAIAMLYDLLCYRNRSSQV